tara:strand:- start:127 stop:468 length:342 start_codon:yes stop_codon:yes gene_type:complete
MLLSEIFDSLLFKFLLGGFIISGISFFSNNIGNTLLAGIIACIPIEMAAIVLVENKRVKSYSWHILIMTCLLVIATSINYYLINNIKLNKYKSVFISISFWFIMALIYYYLIK